MFSRCYHLWNYNFAGERLKEREKESRVNLTMGLDLYSNFFYFRNHSFSKYWKNDFFLFPFVFEFLFLMRCLKSSILPLSLTVQTIHFFIDNFFFLLLADFALRSKIPKSLKQILFMKFCMCFPINSVMVGCRAMLSGVNINGAWILRRSK